jgi:Mg-chelatase subunit ChlD
MVSHAILPKKKSRNAGQLTQLKGAQGTMPKPDDRWGNSVFKKRSPEYNIPIHTFRAEASKSHGRARARKTAFAAFGKRQSNRLWHSGTPDTLASVFHAWRWGRLRPGTEDLMMPVYTSPQQRLVIFLLDVSDSMSETVDLMRLWLAKSMGEAYFRRDPIAVITVQGVGAKLLVHPTTSIHFVLHRLTSVVVGGATPLDQGLLKIGQMIRQCRDRYPAIDLIVISDGRSTGSLMDPNVSASLALIKKFVRKALVVNPIPIADRFARNFASLMGARHFTIQ